MNQFETVQTIGKENVEATLQSFGAAQKGVKAIVVENADYTKRAIELGSAAFERLAGTRSIDGAIQVQADYAKQAYEGFVAHATRVGELASATAQDTVRPFEGVLAKVRAAR